LTPAALREMRLSLSPLIPTIAVSLALSGWWLFVYEIASRFALWHLSTDLYLLLPALLATDLCYYVEHRMAHRARPLWALYHAVHHSSPEYTVATAYRVSFANQLVAPLFYLPCVLIGFEPLLVVSLEIFGIHYQAWVHTRSIGRLPRLDSLLNTPANHRMHHDVRTAEHEVNFGGVFMFWDRLFGTYAEPREVRAFGTGGLQVPVKWYELYTFPIRDWWQRRKESPRRHGPASN
jgi:sterol desaturase/sphingolipid hydroxylase (fatty acid hydroxylase superfamily)